MSRVIAKSRAEIPLKKSPISREWLGQHHFQLYDAPIVLPELDINISLSQLQVEKQEECHMECLPEYKPRHKKTTKFFSDQMKDIYHCILSGGKLPSFFLEKKEPLWTTTDLEIVKTVAMKGIVGVEDLVTDQKVVYLFYAFGVDKTEDIRKMLFERVEFIRNAIFDEDI
ncbi:hypothetical protein EIN_167230 [Entamoeba invadens IP1]|uniref:Uncharacterized protein n=1 Tax=Entamoeba invadens IP1 TaxID=370355 RepID=A0A0A1U0N7_ENTIV|nr:hypothetical protein EIN_167230 [Entamoeba invadens IP1]ELP84438.1 hypothetical protein EIN_167230 [Entamoeba invadens IP1]|eukprot:XP_004183784.1 hypothetical protein EIN_167230 [Entamoeba invadens IP1]